MEISDFPTGVVGPNGSGKTTILKLLGGLLKPPNNKGFIDDKDVNTLNSNQLSKFFAYVSQDNEYTLGFSVEEIIEMGRYPYLGSFSFVSKNDQSIIDKTIEVLGLEKLRSFNTDELSSERNKKVRIARALVQEPQFILLDEPTSNLDLANKILILDVLKNISDLGVGLLITSHDLEFIKQASDNAYMIKNGEILNRGSSKDIIVREKIIKAIVRINNFTRMGVLTILY